jgi:uncharacterized protein involved in exopolysaccharide biosynthesis
MNSASTIPSTEPAVQPDYLPSSSEEFHLDLPRALKMHRQLAIYSGIAVCLLMVLTAAIIGPSYETHSIVYIQPTSTAVVTDGSAPTYDNGRFESYVAQQLQTIVRPDIIKAAIESLPAGTWRKNGETEQAAVNRLAASLVVGRVVNSYEVSIALRGSDPEKTQKVVNAVTNTYLEKGRGDELSQSSGQLQALLAERTRIGSELQTARQEQDSISKALGVADTSSTLTGNPYDVQLNALRTELGTARANHQVAVAQLESVSGNSPAAKAAIDAAADTAALTDSGLMALKTETSNRRAALATQMSGLTDSNPLYQRDKEELDGMDAQIDAMKAKLRAQAASRLQAQLKLEADRTASIVSRLEAQLAGQSSIATQGTPKLQRAQALADSITNLQKRYNEVDNAIRLIQLDHNSAGLVHLSLAASTPEVPLGGKRLVLLGLALPFGIFFGLAAAVMANKLDPKVYIAADVARVLEFQPMAVLPSPFDVDFKVVNEFMLRLVAGIDHAHRADGANMFVFTSASAQAEISDIVASLALKMDRLGYRTIILKSSNSLQTLTTKDGNEDIARLEDETALALASQSNTGLRVKNESFVFERLERIKNNVDLLFIEALPLLSSAETEYMARLADATVIVAKSGQTTRQELKDSLALVRRISAAGVAAVLNGLKLNVADAAFLEAVRSVEDRQAEFRPREPAKRPAEKVPSTVYADLDPIARDR